MGAAGEGGVDEIDARLGVGRQLAPFAEGKLASVGYERKPFA